MWSDSMFIFKYKHLVLVERFVEVYDLFLGDYDRGKLNVNMILYFIRFNWTKADSEAF